jgi:hypothetical protein
LPVRENKLAARVIALRRHLDLAGEIFDMYPSR